MPQEPDCTFRVATPAGQANLCRLGRFGGQVTDGMCRRCIRDGLNHATPPSLADKARNFLAAAARHVAAGMPMCTEEQVTQRFAVCSQCEFFQDGACGKCGCPLVREKRFLSKLAWADQACPIGKWGAADTGK